MDGRSCGGLAAWNNYMDLVMIPANKVIIRYIASPWGFGYTKVIKPVFR